MKVRALFGVALSMMISSSLSHANYADFNHAQVEFNVPEIDAGIGLLDQQKEQSIGEKVYREIQAKMPVVQDPWLDDQLSQVFAQLLSQTQLGRPIGLLLIAEPQINAFAVPGGVFALNTGLLQAAKNMDEVAGVMAHEIAHVSQRHYSRSQEAFKGQGLLAMAGVVVGALIATQGEGEAGGALMMGAQAAILDQQLNYSRNQEREADRIGMQYMYSAGYSPQSMADFFEVMHRSSSRISWMPDFWLTHPLTTQRMSEARLRAQQLPKVMSRWQDDNFDMLKWYSLVMAHQATEAQLLALSARSDAGKLALARFYLQKNEVLAAQAQLNQLQQPQNSRHLATLLQTDVYIAQKQWQKAEQSISSAAKIAPENRTLAYKWAEVMIANGKAQQAHTQLQGFVQRNPRDLMGWRLLQQAVSAQPSSELQTLQVLRYRAEVEYWSGHEEQAIKSLLHAQRLAEQQDVQSMLWQLKTRLNQMQNERQLKI